MPYIATHPFWKSRLQTSTVVHVLLRLTVSLKLLLILAIHHALMMAQMHPNQMLSCTCVAVATDHGSVPNRRQLLLQT